MCERVCVCVCVCVRACARARVCVCLKERKCAYAWECVNVGESGGSIYQEVIAIRCHPLQSYAIRMSGGFPCIDHTSCSIGFCRLAYAVTSELTL